MTTYIDDLHGAGDTWQGTIDGRRHPRTVSVAAPYLQEMRVKDKSFCIALALVLVLVLVLVVVEVVVVVVRVVVQPQHS